jgi:hypothetical protein
MGIVFLSIFFSFCCEQLPANNINNKNNKNNGQHLNNVMIWGINNKLTLGPKVNVKQSLKSGRALVAKRAGGPSARRVACGRVQSLLSPAPRAGGNRSRPAAGTSVWLF